MVAASRSVSLAEILLSIYDYTVTVLKYQFLAQNTVLIFKQTTMTVSINSSFFFFHYSSRLVPFFSQLCVYFGSGSVLFPSLNSARNNHSRVRILTTVF